MLFSCVVSVVILPADSWLTESQTGRGWQGPLGVPQPNPLPKQGHPEQGAQHRVQAGLEYLQRRLHSLPGQPGPGLWHPPREEALPRVQTEGFYSLHNHPPAVPPAPRSIPQRTNGVRGNYSALSSNRHPSKIGGGEGGEIRLNRVKHPKTG